LRCGILHTNAPSFRAARSAVLVRTQFMLLRILLPLAAAAAGVGAQLPPKAPPATDDIPCSRWQILNDHNAVWSRVGSGCNGGAPNKPPCRGEVGQGVGKHYFFLGVADSMAECLGLAQEPLPDSAVKNQGKEGPHICQTVAYHTAAFAGQFSKHCYCGAAAEFIAAEHTEKGIDSASCQAYGEPTGGVTFSVLLLILLAAYAVGGIALGQHRGGSSGGVRGVKAHPHYANLVALGGLVQDGIAFTRAGGTRPQKQPRGVGGRRDDGSAALLDVEAGGSRGGGGRKSEKSSSSGKERKESSKKSTKEKKQKARSGGSGGTSSKGGDSTLPAPPASVAAAPAAPAPATAAWAGSTASGGGGRWVHVPT
jgi:hypothetical protein